MKIRTFATILSLGFFPLLTGAESTHPVPESPLWLTYQGGEGPGKGKHIVLIAADQEYRSEQSLPMLAGIFSRHHGFDCTVLFGVNDAGLVDPTLPVYPQQGEEAAFKQHNIPGLEHLEKADLLILKTRLLTLPQEQLQHLVNYLDSGRPIIGLRSANHGFRSPLPYKIDGQQISIGQLLGGSFLEHHGNWRRDSTLGDPRPVMKDHPILTGVRDIWGPSDDRQRRLLGNGAGRAHHLRKQREPHGQLPASGQRLQLREAGRRPPAARRLPVIGLPPEHPALPAGLMRPKWIFLKGGDPNPWGADTMTATCAAHCPR